MRVPAVHRIFACIKRLPYRYMETNYMTSVICVNVGMWEVYSCRPYKIISKYKSECHSIPEPGGGTNREREETSDTMY